MICFCPKFPQRSRNDLRMGKGDSFLQTQNMPPGGSLHFKQMGASDSEVLDMAMCEVLLEEASRTYPVHSCVTLCMFMYSFKP